jgi:SPP1 family predicted phage head-tail adaptor
MQAGKFDRRIQVQLATFSNDASGDPVASWADAFKRWARRRLRGGSQGEGAGSILRQFSVDFTVRDDSGTRTIAPETHRIVYDGREYTINGITEGEEGRHRIRVISCSTRPDLRGTMAQGPSDVPF